MESKKSITLLVMSLVLELTSAEADSHVSTTPSENPSLGARRLPERNDLRSIFSRLREPNFWPTKGRRSDPELLNRLFASRSETEHQRDELVNRGRKTNDEESGVFWAGRGRSIDDDPSGTFWAGRGRSTDDDPSGTFWAGRGRSLAEAVSDLTSWDNPVDDDPTGTFWAGRGRSLDVNPTEIAWKERSSESDPTKTFWANRGRSIEEAPKDKDKEAPEEDTEVETRWRRHRMYVEEPGWVWLSRRDVQPSYDVSFLGSSMPMSERGRWVAARGKKHKKQKREIKSGFACTPFHPKRNSKDLIQELMQLNLNQFRPARGKRPELGDALCSLTRKKEFPGRI